MLLLILELISTPSITLIKSVCLGVITVSVLVITYKYWRLASSKNDTVSPHFTWEISQMLNEKLTDLKKEQLDKAAQELNSIKETLEKQLNEQTYSNPLKDELLEFFREIAALRGENIDKVLRETVEGIENYIEGTNIEVKFKLGLPTDINKYIKKVTSIAQGIEFCWDLFSEESHQYFIAIADAFLKAYSKLKTWQKLVLKLKLLTPSILQGKNFFEDYKNASLAIPKAVAKSLEIRESKETKQLQVTAEALKNHITSKAKSDLGGLSPYLKHLGVNREDQIRKNQDAMRWAETRLKEIRNNKR